MGERPRVQLRLTEQARDGLYALASREKVTLTALLEAMGRAHQTLTLDRDLVEAARRIDRERHSRR